MARAAAHSTRQVRTIQACTVKVEDKEKKRKSHDTRTIFTVGGCLLTYTQVCTRQGASAHGAALVCKSLQQIQHKQGPTLHFIDQTTR